MTTSRANTANAIAALLRERLPHLANRGTNLNEASTLDLLIKPTLEALGYPPTHRIPEHGKQRNRLDDSCYLQPVTDKSDANAAIIVEAKQLGVNFDRLTPGQGRADSPDRQIRRYLERHDASGRNTLGVLTDGARWRIYRRGGSPETPQAELVTETDFDFSPLDGSQSAIFGLTPSLQEQLERLVELLSWESINYRTTPARVAAPPSRRAAELFSAMAGDAFTPADLLGNLVNDANVASQSNLADTLTLLGKAADAHAKDWERYAYTPGLTIKSDNQVLPGQELRAVVAAVQFKQQENAGLSRPDVALAARTFANANPARAAALLAYTTAADGEREARLAVAANGQVNMTAAFDPTLAAPSARAAADQLLQLLHQPPAAGLTAEQLMLPLEASQLRQQFYREVARWTADRQAGKDRPQREAVLRHLVRVMFAWILKEENIIPPELFEQAFANAALPNADAYHRDILRFLFHRRLNVLVDKRDDHSNARINGAMEQVPFLNGSLFAPHDDDDALDIPAAAYWNADSTKPGLFTILSRYHWTLDEHRPGESEQTLDPELLSNLFERLITPTVEGTAAPLRQPQGTYYTPADVADEMVKDALAAAVRDYAPAAVSDAQLLELFGSSDAALPELTVGERDKLARRIKGLRIFDPAVGSGEFLFSVLTALRRALGLLEPGAANPVADIIRRQLAGQDINPLAVQITRLRLFIAITAAERHNPNRGPLPNLEARIVCADTLATVANPEWRPERPGQLTDALPELTTTLAAAAANRAEWFDAHTEEAKQETLAAESRLRDELERLLQSRRELASPELVGFARTELYDKNPRPAKTDARLLFYENPWRGFDVVIGNPPYEALKESMDKAAVNALKDHKGYQTTNVADLYSLFCETGLALANPEGGVVTLVVPLSISFGQQQRSIRQVFEQACREISLRHYDNNPGRTFANSPTVRDVRNNQRITIVVAKVGKEEKPAIRTTGQQRWPSEDRERCIAQKGTTPLPDLLEGIDSRIAKQWARIPTPEVSAMVEAIVNQKNTVASYYSDGGEVMLAMQQTARYFISSLPAGSVSPRSENRFQVATENDLHLLMAVLNGHIGYGWWMVYGDGFHVNTHELLSLTVPDSWVANPQPAIEIGQHLVAAIPDCITAHPRQGIDWKNADFHTYKPALIEEIDRLHLAALGFTGAAQDKVLGHLRIMRSSSSWRYPG